MESEGFARLFNEFAEDWEIRIKDLIKRSKSGRDAIYGAVQELKEAGYLTSDYHRQGNGRFNTLGYIAHEIPQSQDSSSQANASLIRTKQDPDVTPLLGKSAKNGSFSAKLMEEKELAIQKTLRSLQQQLQERQGEYQHLQYLISSANYQQDPSTVEQLRQQIVTCRDAIDQLKKTFNDCVLQNSAMHKNDEPTKSTEGFHHSDTTTKQENNHVTN